MQSYSSLILGNVNWLFVIVRMEELRISLCFSFGTEDKMSHTYKSSWNLEVIYLIVGFTYPPTNLFLRMAMQIPTKVTDDAAADRKVDSLNTHWMWWWWQILFKSGLIIFPIDSIPIENHDWKVSQSVRVARHNTIVRAICVCFLTAVTNLH